MQTAIKGPRRLLRPMLTSRSATPRRPFRREARSPGVRTFHFAARTSDLRRRPLVAGALRSTGRSPRCSTPRIRFLSIAPRFRSTLPSRRPRGRTLCASLRSLQPAFERTRTSCVSFMSDAPLASLRSDTARDCRSSALHRARCRLCWGFDGAPLARTTDQISRAMMVTNCARIEAGARPITVALAELRA